MHSVVGCSNCSALWIVSDRPETTQCPRCGTRRQFSKLKRFVETEDADHARDVRASMLANRQGEGETFAGMDSFAAMDDQLDDVGVDDETYLEASGLDADAVADAGEYAERGQSGGQSRKDVVLSALDELDAPDEQAVVTYAKERGVPEDYVRDALAKLVRRGEVSESGGRYRRL